MPYPGIPEGSEMERKIESCVEQVMADDPSLDKSSAVAICRDSVEDKDIEKFMGSMPLDFNELDAERQAYEQAEMFMQMSRDFQHLVHNTLLSGEIEMADKAVAIRQLANQLADRVERLSFADKESKRKGGLLNKFVTALKE